MTGADDEGGFFTPELYRFLRELKKNNNREWFQKNKERYERVIREPAFRFIREVGPGLSQLSKYVIADDRPSGGSLYRIYRDVRFSKDKSPYKTIVGIHFQHVGLEGNGGSFPGFYLHLAPGDNFAASGVWGPDPVALEKIRKAMIADPTGWRKARGVPLSEHGERLKRVPRGFDPEHPLAEDLKRKDFVASRPITDASVVDPGLPRTFLRECARLNPLNQFLARAMGLEY